MIKIFNAKIQQFFEIGEEFDKNKQGLQSNVVMEYHKKKHK